MIVKLFQLMIPEQKLNLVSFLTFMIQ